MPDVLALRLSGPLQSWGGHSRHTTRGTLTHPTKSGVVGLCAAALGRGRGEPLTDLAALDFGVRIDRPGTLLVDYHTISAASHGPLAPRSQRLPTAKGSRLSPGESKISRRSYLQNAVFVTALVADTPNRIDLLNRIEAALTQPRYPLFLGRRSCPPDRRVLLDRYRDTTLLRVLREIPWQARYGTPPKQLPIVVDDATGGELLPDLPLPGPAFQRAFADRPVRHDQVPVSGTEARIDEDGDPDPSFSGDSSMSLLDEFGEGSH